MCAMFGGSPKPDTPDVPGPPIPAPPQALTEKLPVPLPPTRIDRGPQDLARRKEKPIVKSKRVKKDKLSEGTTQLQINPTPASGGTNVGTNTGTTTPTSTNTGVVRP